jgi:hypothetical protein
MSNTSLLGSYGGLGESSLMFRNRIINGSMAIDQRNAGVAVTVTANASAVHTLDRWRVFSAGSNATVARVAGSGSNQYALRITGAVSNTGTVLEQRIEASNCYDLVNNAVTVSFQVSSTSITTLNWSADYPTGGVDNWSGATAIASGSVTINSTNNTYSFTFNAGANVVNGLRITFTSGALLGSQTITYQQVQLEAGPVATPFERRPIGVELGMAMRYYQKIDRRNLTPNGYVGIGPTVVPMRMAPACVIGEVRGLATGALLFSNVSAVGENELDLGYIDTATTSTISCYNIRIDAEL